MVSIAVCSLAPSVSAQRVGVVTNVEGMATVARVALPQPQPLWFKDDVFLKDRVTSRLTAELGMIPSSAPSASSAPTIEAAVQQAYTLSPAVNANATLGSRLKK